MDDDGRVQLGRPDGPSDVPDPDTKADWWQEDENAFFAAHGYCSLRGLAELQAQAVELHESFAEAREAIEAAGGALVKRGERPMGPRAARQAIASNRRIVRRLGTRLRPAPLLRTAAPRRIAARRHRRHATRQQTASSDDGSSPEPPPEKLTLAVACASLAAGFAVGAALAVVLR